MPDSPSSQGYVLSQQARDRGAFDALVATVAGCRRCPRMEGRTHVLGSANGPLSARVLFVAEAPGRFGADAAGVPLAGDRTGRAFEQLLACAGLRRSDIFITNAVLCNPRDAKGRNDRPSRSEIVNCNHHLARLLTILDTMCLRQDVGQPISWFGRMLIPLYHPGPRALIHRPQHLQEGDYRRLAALISGAPRDRARSIPEPQA